MVSSGQLIAIFFRLLNFFALVGLFFYLIKRYVYPTMKHLFVTYRAQLDDFYRSHRALMNDHHMMERTVVNDLQRQEELKKMMLMWSENVKTQHELIVQERDKRKQELDARMESCKRHIETQLIYKQIMLDALDEARTQLMSSYAHTENQRRFIDAIITTMRKW